MLGRTLHDRLDSLLRRQRRHEPRWRPLVNELLREPSAALVEALIARRLDAGAGLGLAEERYVPGEDEAIESLLETFAERVEAGPAAPPKAGSTTQALVRAELSTASDLPRRYRKGIFAEPHTYPAWACFHGPGPDGSPDIDALGLSALSGACGPRLDVKLMKVPGTKLLEDEKHTQDLCSVGTPTSPTASVLDSAQLLRWRRRQTPLFYFIDPRRQHLLELLIHALNAEPAQNPLERRYYASGPLLLGQGQAMLYSLRPRAIPPTGAPDLPGRPAEHGQREALMNTLASEDVLFDLLIQPQTDPQTMPIEDAAVRWPERLSPWLVAGTLRIVKQLGSPEQHLFARRLRFTPWHALPEHRPLGSQNRARRLLYRELLAAEGKRAPAPQDRHLEPTGDEVFGSAQGRVSEGDSPGEPPEPGAPAQPEERIARSATRQTRSGAPATPGLAAARGRG